MKVTHTICILLLLLLICLSSSKTKYPQGLWPLQIFGTFSEMVHQKILAYYDFNRDRYTDIITQSSNQTSRADSSQQQLSTYLNFYLWNNKQQKFEKHMQVSMGAMHIDNVAITDFDHNGGMDVVVTTLNAEGNKIATIYEMVCLDNKCTFYGKDKLLKSVLYSNSSVGVFLINGMNNILVSKEDRIVALTYSEQTKQLTQQSFTDKLMTGENKDKVCSNFNKIFYVDYNGDCIQDMVMACHQNGQDLIQFLEGQAGGSFSYKYQYPIIEAGSNHQNLDILIKDINFDGVPDIVFLNRNKDNGFKILQIHYNNAVKSILEQCTVLQSKFFPYDFVSAEELTINKIYKIQRIYLDHIEEVGQPSTFKLKAGDYNNDGFTDLIIDGNTTAYLYENQYCTSQCDKSTYNSKFMKEWSILAIRTFHLTTIKMPSSATVCDMSFFDLYEDGKLDILANTCTPGTSCGPILPILNSLNLDAFFIKVLILNNLENQKVQQKTIDFRFNSNGGHIDMYVTSLSGSRMPISGDQLSSSGCQPELPFIHLGLGRTNNYIEQLVASLNVKDKAQSFIWTPIVPNSQLFIVPGPQKWVLKSFISPTAVMGVVFWFVVIILIAMGCYIGHLTRKQKLQDKENEQSFYLTLA